VNGFERYYINNVVGAAFVVIGAAVNVVVLLLGYGLVELVAATTAVRMIPYWLYRRNAHKVFPELRIRVRYFRRDWLRELTGFSAYLAVIDWAGKLAYTTDMIILGIFMNTTVVAVYAVAQKVSDALHKMTNQLHTFLFPAVVYQSVEGEAAAQRRMLVTVTRFQLSVSVALCGAVATDADLLIRGWVGPDFDGAALVLRVLAAVVVIRTLMSMPGTVLKGTGHHKTLAAGTSVAALANLLLSVVAVKSFGMVGVVWATFVPTLALAATFIFPLGCRAVGLGVKQGYRQIVWPALWPATVMIAALAATRDLLPVPNGGLATLSAVLAHIALGGLIYAGTFFLFGLDRTERQWFSSAVTQVWRRSLATA
jgi:O-antigen/teichoic acid export membrane protein